MRQILLQANDADPPALLDETSQPGTWSLTGTEWNRRRTTLNRAVTLALQNGAKRLLFPGMNTSDPDYPFTKGSNNTRHEDGGTVMELIVPAQDGEVHDDYDRRTPVSQITCCTCLTRIAEGRVMDRAEAMAKGKTHRARSAAQHARRIAEAYQRLADVEDTIASLWERENPGETSPVDQGITTSEDGLYRMEPRLPIPLFLTHDLVRRRGRPTEEEQPGTGEEPVNGTKRSEEESS